MVKEKPPREKPFSNGKVPVNGARTQAALKTLGPVGRLEDHVHPDWWQRIFNSVYLKTDSDVVEDPVITRSEVDAYVARLGLKPEDKILDLCCGQGRHTFELLERGFENVEGLDRSHYLIEKAKSRARRDRRRVRFREGEARKLPYQPDTFDALMIAGNSFGYFDTIEDDLKVLKESLRVLKPWGRLLIDVADGEYLRQNFEPRAWEWLDNKHFVCRERSLSLDGERLITREVVTHIDRGVIADQFYAERLYSHDGLGDMLSVAGFNDVTFHGAHTPNSQRAQDLGMMGHRIMVTGIVRKDWSPVRQRPKGATRNFVVVMGDPTKPDLLKPSTTFDDDDFFTIDRLKEALRGLPEYRVSYLDSHDTLIRDLARRSGTIDLVMNLCDEGFQNDARKELHVASLLEQLEIPYTGAGPQCLAYCYDKSLVRGVAKEMGIPVPEAFFIKPQDSAFELPFGFPVIVKPNFGDSSFGITQRSVANSLDELLQAVAEIRDMLGYEKPLLVEEFLTGQDLSVGLIGNPPASYSVLPVVAEDYSLIPDDLPKICGYEAKWDPESPYWKLRSVPANLPAGTERLIIDCCVKLFERLECRDYARFDWRLDSGGNPKLLEVNPNPGWCYDGHLARMAKMAGISYKDMLGMILAAAENRLGMPDTREQPEAAPPSRP